MYFELEYNIETIKNLLIILILKFEQNTRKKKKSRNLNKF
jgi:hypothetical protein